MTVTNTKYNFYIAIFDGIIGKILFILPIMSFSYWKYEAKRVKVKICFRLVFEKNSYEWILFKNNKIKTYKYINSLL